jgi:hypothetical protein
MMTPRTIKWDPKTRIFGAEFGIFVEGVFLHRFIQVSKMEGIQPTKYTYDMMLI